MSMMSMGCFKGIFWPILKPSIPQGGSWISDSEMTVLLAIVAKFKPKMFVEIGAWKGGTAARILADSPFIEEYVAVDSCDPKRENPIPTEEIGMEAKDDARYRLMVSVEGSSSPEVEKLEADMVFVDAAHTYGWCLHDSLLARRIVKQGGVVIWHDFNCCAGVTKTIIELNSQDNDSIIWVEDTWICFEIVNDKAGLVTRLEHLKV